MNGDLILVAWGDPNLSGRIQPDGHYGSRTRTIRTTGVRTLKRSPGDPLLVIRELAEQVAAKGVKRVEGHVIVDATLCSEKAAANWHWQTVISPISVNDNCVDFNVAPGAKVATGGITVSPATSYVTFVNRAVTGSIKFASRY